MVTLNSDQRRVLKILEGCPAGVTDYNLSLRFGVSMETMLDLALAKLVSIREHRLAHGPATQCWLCITPLGLKALEASQKDLHQKVRDIIPALTVQDILKHK
jgi:hypothetical protein